MTRHLASLPVLMAFAILLASCGGAGGSSPLSSGPSPTPYTAKSGVAQKGPLIKGSTVTAQELDTNLSPTGKQYSYQTTSDLGAFSPTSTFGSQYIGVNATGYYFDELLDAVSDGPVTLNGYSDLATDTTLNVNILTTLAYQRIQNLVVNSKLSFTAARVQAEKEVLTALNIPTAAYVPFDSLDLAGGTDADHILAAISSLFVYNNASGPMSALIANFQSDIGANGKLTVATTRNALAAAGQGVNPNAVAANLTQRYSSVGVTFTATDIADWIDHDGDGIVGKFKFQVADATSSSVFTFPTLVLAQIAGTSVSVTAGRLSVNGTPVTGAVTVNPGDVVAVTPGMGMFPNGVLTVYLMSGTTRTARVSFVSGLQSIAVTPALPSAPKGVTQQFKATGIFSDNSTADLTSSVTWTSGDTGIATVGATSGLAQTLGVGSTLIRATSGTVSGSATLNVTAAVLESISITPNPAFSGVGLNTQLTATGTYSDSTTAIVTSTTTWTSATPSVATVGQATGLVTGVSLGGTTVSATVGSATANAQLSITVNTWHPAANMILSPRCGYTATRLLNGKVLTAAGADCSGGVTKFATQLYDPAANTWSQGGSLSTSRAGHAATLLQDGKVLVAGGENLPDAVFVPTSLASAEVYDPMTDTWSSAGNMSLARLGHTATLLQDGRVLVAGGDAANVTATAELYDPITSTWSPAASLATARFGHTATLLQNGQVLVAGGAGPGGAPLVTAELYDPVANTWSAAGSMSTSRVSDTATLLSSGKVLVAGGFTDNGAAPDTASVEIYDPGANAWSSAASLPTPLSDHAASLLPSGKVLISGGDVPGSGPTASAQLYDPAANTWSPTGSMSSRRADHISTQLLNGVVLVTGGDGGISCELYW